MAAKAVGIPPVGHAAGISYRLLSINAGIGLDLAQTISLDLGCPIVLSFNSVHFADTDPSMLNQLGERNFMVDGDTLALATHQPGELGTDASQRRCSTPPAIRPTASPWSRRSVCPAPCLSPSAGP